MINSFFFYGIIEGEDVDETWKVLHDHFEKLAREDDARQKDIVRFDGKGKKCSK